jgi:hypothetical protein
VNNEDQNINKHNLPFELNRKVKDLLEKSKKEDITESEKKWIKNTLNLLEISEKLQSPPKKSNTWSVVSVLICIALASLLLWLKVGDIGFIKSLASNDFSLIIQTNEVNLIIDFHANQLSEIQISNAQRSLNDSNNNLELKVEGKSMTLNELESEPNAFVHIKNYNNNTEISILNSKISGSLVVYLGNIKVPAYFESQVKDSLDPEFIDFQLDSSDSVFPSTIYLETKNNLNLLNGKKINDIGFLSEYIENMDESKQQSSIIYGKLKIPSINWETELNSKEVLLFENLEAYITGFTITEDLMEIKLTGRARSIKTGYFDTVKNQCPTLLEFLYKNQPLVLFWSVIVFLWGLIKSVKDRFT